MNKTLKYGWVEPVRNTEENKDGEKVPLMKTGQGYKKEEVFDCLPRHPRYRYEDLILPDDILHELDVLQNMIQFHSVVYREWGMENIDPYGGQIAFNLFGPPGTGKTMIVEALCNRWNKELIDVNLSDLESKYVGETGKNIVKAFDAAKQNDAVLFFDEADAVLGRRLTNVTQSSDNAVNAARGVMLKQLEQHSGIVAFATNCAKNYDSAFVRRILKHIHIPLPDSSSREKLWRSKIPVKVPGYEDMDFVELARQSEGLSGGEILVAAKNALFDAVGAKERRLTFPLLLKAVANVNEAKKEIGSLPCLM